MIKIGISYTTYNKIELCKYSIKMLFKYTIKYYPQYQFVISVSDDGSRDYRVLKKYMSRLQFTNKNCKILYCTGRLANIAKNKNRALLPIYNEQCDYIFMFDDDCATCDPRWLSSYIDALNRYGHLMYSPYWYSKTLGNINTFMLDNNTIHIDHHEKYCGRILALNKAVLNRVGGFDTNFDWYGCYNIDYSERCNYVVGNVTNKVLDIHEAAEQHWFLCLDDYQYTKWSHWFNQEEMHKLIVPLTEEQKKSRELSLANNIKRLQHCRSLREATKVVWKNIDV